MSDLFDVYNDLTVAEKVKKEQKEIIKLFKDEVIFTKSSFDTKKFSMDEELSWFDGISLEHVDDFCNNLYDLTQKYHD